MIGYSLFFAAAAVAWAAPCTESTATCTERVVVDGGAYLTVYRSHALTAVDTSVERAFILVHGTLRDGDRYFQTATAVTRDAGRSDRTLVIAPQFRANDGASCTDQAAPAELLFPCNGWKDGERALNGTGDSFAVMDRLLTLLDDRGRFPKLQEIVLAGHSAGGQYVQRYAAVNRVEARLHTPVRYLVANPSSYLYLEPWRPVSHPCRLFDHYKYGLAELTGYAAGTGAAAIRATYPKRNVTYLLGELDTTDEHSLDKSCPAMAQGANRFDRGMTFYQRITARFHATHQLVRVPGCAHDALCMYGSTPGRSAVFRESLP